VLLGHSRFKIGPREKRRVGRKRLRIGNARYPRQQPVEFRRQRSVSRQIAEPNATTLAQNPRELIGRSLFVRERTESALADDRVE
jgi:hypothetical protein